MEKWSNNKLKKSVPESLKTQITQDEWNSLPSYSRYRYQKKDALSDGRYDKKIKEVPENFKNVFTLKEWINLGKYKRYKVLNPERKQRDRIARRVQKFQNLEKWDKQQLNSKLRREFGITADDFYTLLKGQRGVCALCGKSERVTYKKEIQEGVFVETPKRLSVDHDHETGKIRGLLCFDCNKRLYSNNSEGLNWIKSAAKYLENS